MPPRPFAPKALAPRRFALLNPFPPRKFWLVPNPFTPNPVAPNPFAPNPFPPNPDTPNPFPPNPVATNPVAQNPFPPNPLAPNPLPPNPLAPNPLAPKRLAFPPNPVAPRRLVFAPRPFPAKRPLCPSPNCWPEKFQNQLKIIVRGEQHGVVVILTACHSKGLHEGHKNACNSPNTVL